MCVAAQVTAVTLPVQSRATVGHCAQCLDVNASDTAAALTMPGHRKLHRPVDHWQGDLRCLHRIVKICTLVRSATSAAHCQKQLHACPSPIGAAACPRRQVWVQA